MEVVTIRNRSEISSGRFNELNDLSFNLFAKSAKDLPSIWQNYGWDSKEQFRRDWLEMMKKDDFILFLINRKSDNSIIGYAAGYAISTAKEFRHEINVRKKIGSEVIDDFFAVPEKTFLFSEIGVREDLRGHGVGKMLISLRFAFALQIPDIKRMIFFTHPKAQTPRGFYQELGFRQRNLNIPGRENDLQFFVYKVLEPKMKVD